MTDQVNNNGEVFTPMQPLPNVVASYREDIDPTTEWTVAPSTGDFGVGVDFASGVVSVPLTGDDHARLVRLREMVRLRVSPTDSSFISNVAKRYKGHNRKLTEPLLRIMEEGRIGAITRQYAESMGIPIEVDGSEKVIGKRLATAASVRDWDKCVEFAALHFGTKKFDQFATGVRSVNSEWSKQLVRLNKELISAFNESISDLGNTMSTDFGDGNRGPIGFNHTIYGASVAANYMSEGYRAPNAVKQQLEEQQDKRASNYGEPDIEELLKGYGKIEPNESLNVDDLPPDFEFQTDREEDNYEEYFGPLIFNESMALTVEVHGYMARKRSARQTGRTIAYPGRMLTDPERRVFGHKTKVKGGVVVIDISGSMHLSQSDIEAIVEVAPAALIMAYSDPDNGAGAPNAHILANRGWRIKEFTNVDRGGNGVDGTALTWAVRHKKFGEDIVWVSDGHVFGINGARSSKLAVQCAQLVKKHKIIMIPSVTAAVAAFKSGKPIRQYNTPVGPIREALLGRYN